MKDKTNLVELTEICVLFISLQIQKTITTKDKYKEEEKKNDYFISTSLDAPL